MERYVILNGIALLLAGAVLYYILTEFNIGQADVVFETLMAITVLVLSSGSIINAWYDDNNSRNPINNLFLRAIQWGAPKRSFQNRDRSVETLTWYFPYGAFVILSFGLLLGLVIEFRYGNVDDVIYGLWFDGLGAGLIGSSIFLDTRELEAGVQSEVRVAEGEFASDNSTYHFWGLMLLITGFFLQIVAILLGTF